MCVHSHCYYIVQRTTDQEFPGEDGNDLQFSLHRWKCFDMNLICKYLCCVVWCGCSVCVVSNICWTRWVINYIPDNMIDWGVLCALALLPFDKVQWVIGRGVCMDYNRTNAFEGDWWLGGMAEWLGVSFRWLGRFAYCPTCSVPCVFSAEGAQLGEGCGTGGLVWEPASSDSKTWSTHRKTQGLAATPGRVCEPCSVIRQQQVRIQWSGRYMWI